MENNEMHDQWVDRRLAVLDPPKTWQPNAIRALAQVRERRKAYRIRRTRFTWAAVAASVTACGLFLLTPAPCSGAGCSKAAGAQSAPTAALGPIAAPPPPPPVTLAQAARPAPATPAAATPKPQAARPASAAPASTPAPNFKESGNVLAPITCEIFSDYECPHCALVFLQMMPGFVKDYVRTGKVKLVHRDFPLQQHQYAKLAARYANAAGVLGYYDIAVTQIFRTQAIWGAGGDIGTQVAQVLPPGVMEKVRNLVRNDAHLDDSVVTDVSIGRLEQLNQTPSMVVAYKGKRQLLAPIPRYELLKSYLDELLTK
jgi:protein-disulfide isomerase